VRWLIVDVGVIGSLLGTSLADAGEDVSFLVTDGKRKKLYEEYGINIVLFPGEKRNHRINIVAAGAKGEYDIIIIPIRVHMYTSKLMEILKKFVLEKTLIIPVTAMFDLPKNLMNELEGNVRAVMYPYAIGGRMLYPRRLLKTN
jgi:2-dehydropantoate 2-reductase